MNWNRKKKPDRFSLIFRAMSSMAIVMNTGKFETFKPDIYIEENYDFSPYGLDADIIHTPGHSKGSISILTGDGNLFCGDFLYNFFGTPRLEVCDNLTDFKESARKLKSHEIDMFYPGHGKPFTMKQFLKEY